MNQSVQSKLRHRNLQFWYTNADQLLNKRDCLSMAVCGEEPDLIFITEVLPKASGLPIPPALLSLPGYMLFNNFHCDEGLVSNGIRGVCTYVRDTLSASEVSFTNTTFQEQLWLKLRLDGGDTLYLGCIYRSPSGDPYMSVRDLSHLLESVCALNPSHLLIVGDFNLPQIDWRQNLCMTSESHYAAKFFSAVQDAYLFQHVKEPTRFRDGVEPSLLDLIMTNEEHMIERLDYCPGLGKSDHVLIKGQLACYSTSVEAASIKWNLSRADFQKLGKKIDGTDWSSLSVLDVNTGYQQFRETLLTLMGECIPRSKSTHKRKNIYMNRKAFKLKKHKHQLWSAYKSSQDSVDLARFRLCRNKLRGLTRQLRHNFEAQLVSNLKANPKAFWRYSNSRLKVRPRIGDLRNSSGALVSDDETKAVILNDFFAGVFTVENTSCIPELTKHHTGDLLEDITISRHAIAQKLQALKATSSPGPDGIHPRVLKELSLTLSLPLALLYRKSIDTGELPDVWKQAWIVPIHKKGSKREPGNYRPVSLTSVACKVLESLIRDALMEHLDTHSLLTDDQHGFRPRRSCSTQLLETIDAWSKILEEGTALDVIYLDFRKAFDSVPHMRLLCKLQSYGVSGKLLSWIKAFLSGRSQQVSLGGCHSSVINVTSGVPQGSVLGPLLFLLYVNDLPEVVSCPVKLFADDTKLFSGMASMDDALKLQTDLDALVKWSETWQMPFNEDKCRVMHIGAGNQDFVFHMGRTQLQISGVEKDLGVYIDAPLKFRQQAASAVAKATQILAVIRRSFVLIDEYTLPLLFKSLVRPHLEYGNLVWGPFNRADQRAIERVQRRATRLVTSIRHHDYQTRLRILKLPSLYYRRRRGDMIHLYQMMHAGVDVEASEMFTLNAGGFTRGHSLKICKPHVSARVRQNSFAVRSINDWNGLPAVIVNSPSVDIFKQRLDSFWESLWYSIPDTE